VSSISEPFVRRPVATTLLSIAIALAGILGYTLLPVSPLPQVDFPTVQVQAGLPGASPETMASAVATPLERQFGRIAGVTELTSSSSLGSTGVVLQFALNRNIDAAARDVQAAINAARGQLPAGLPNNPSYRKINPADAPILILALTSDIMETSKVYDAASSILMQKLSQIQGIGQVSVGGSALPAVRVELDPQVVNKYGIGFEQIRTFLASVNANRPKGQIAGGDEASQLFTTDQLLHASQYQNLVVGYKKGAAIRLSSLGEIVDSVQDLRNAGVANGKPAVLMIIFRQPGANIIEAVDRVKGALPGLRAAINPSIAIGIMMDRTTTIRASVVDVEITLVISILLVILVVFIFLRNVWATLIPSVAVPLSLLGTFGGMYLMGYSIDNLSLMALTISTGFVVDDAIVVIENITRYLEMGMAPMRAALVGSKEIGFTVLSMSVSLIAVFIPLLLMGGIVGRLFREFAVVLSMAIAISLAVSLTTTPMMCARLLKSQHDKKHNWAYRVSERVFEGILHKYEFGLNWVLEHYGITLVVWGFTVAVSVFLFIKIPKGFFPDQDTGRLQGAIQASQDSSFQSMHGRLAQFEKLVLQDPAVDTIAGFTGGGSTNTGRMFISLKPLAERKVSAAQVAARLRGKLNRVPGASLFLVPAQDIRVGGRQSNANYQFTLQGDTLKDITDWTPRMMAKMRTIPILHDVNSDQQDRGLQANLEIDRDTAYRLGLTTELIDNTLYDAFGQRQVSTMYTPLNQYHVIMEVAPKYWQNPDVLRDIYVHAPNGSQIPLSAFSHFSAKNTTLTVSHQSQFPAYTISFNLDPGVALGDAVREINIARQEIGMPASIQAKFQGTAQAYQESLANEPVLIAAALLTVYIVLGILYESLIHPITILSTLPSAGVGALLALILFKQELTVIALIGIILLIGIVKKNAIMMIDFALAAERNEDKTPRQAIYQACVLRFRPIMMTTAAALLGGLPLALGTGTGSEMRRPLGIAIVGGLLVSQMLTLFTTPVIYLVLDRLRLRAEAYRRRGARTFLGSKA
jgi:multidrug efflux pump